MRITRFLHTLAFASVVSLAGPLSVHAQTEQPVAGQQNFGPRVKPAIPGQPPVQQAPPAAPAADTIGTFGAWQIQCGTAQKPDGSPDPAAKKQCGMVQITKNEKNPKVGLSLIIVKAKQADKDVLMMRVMVPIGVYLPTGVALEVDGEAVGRVPFTRCRPQICEAFAEASKPTLDKMKKGGAANFIIYEAPGLGIPMKISLEGFSTGLDLLLKQ